MRRIRVSWWLLALVLVVGCSPTTTTAPARATTGEPTTRPAAPIVVTIAAMGEPPTFVQELVQGSNVGAGMATAQSVAHDRLVVDDDQGGYQPLLAAAQISVANGTWRINADGSMDTTWKLRPNVKWHDGAPFTADDLVFAYSVFKDPDIPNSIGQPLRLMESVVASDPHTLVVHWTTPYVNADQAPGLVPLPRHLLEPVLREGKAAFATSPLLSTQWVGLGPFRLTRWESGVEMEFARFDDYHRGRPPFDTVILRFFTDPNTMVASILAEAVDVILPVAVDIPTAVEVRRRWEGTGHQVTFPPRDGLRHLEIQSRPELEQPRGSTTNRNVRAALYHALDRQTLVDVVTDGIAPLADSWIPPTGELRQQVQADIPQFPFDIARANQLLEGERWARGADGVRVNQATGERLEILLYGSMVGSTEREQNVIAEGWKAAGVAPKFYVIPSALSTDREHRAKLPGLGLVGVGFDAWVTDRLHSKSIPADANRWNGANRGGYVNPRVDAVLDRLVVTIAPDGRLPLHRDLLREQMGDVALMPLYWNADPVLARREITGIPKTEGKAAARAILFWNKT